jgi:chloramphenicol-sensitive protein RarD
LADAARPDSARRGATPPAGGDTGAGLAFAVSAYLIWGILPLYMKELAHIPPSEVVAHRILWSIPIAGAVLWLTGRTADLRSALGQPRTLAMAALTAGLLSVNWGLYVSAIAASRALDAALAYFINPLFAVALGALLLGERMTRLQLLAIALAAAAVVLLGVQAGSPPWLALSMTLTWGLYAYFRKSLPIGPNQGFLLEVLILAPAALVWIAVLVATGQSHFFVTAPADGWLLLGTGVATAVPLLLYGNGAKRLRLSTIGMLQYISPTLVFLIAVILFDEPFAAAERLAFPMIWAALALYSWSLWRRARPA